MKRPSGCCRRILNPSWRLRTPSQTFASGGVGGWRKSRDRWRMMGETEWPLGCVMLVLPADSPSPSPLRPGEGRVRASSWSWPVRLARGPGRLPHRPKIAAHLAGVEPDDLVSALLEPRRAGGVVGRLVGGGVR